MPCRWGIRSKHDDLCSRYMNVFCFFLQPLASWLCLKPINQRKFPESSWKATYYGCMWSYVTYLLIFSGRYDFFHKPYLMWQGKSGTIEPQSMLLSCMLLVNRFTIYSVSWMRHNVAYVHYFYYNNTVYHKNILSVGKIKEIMAILVYVKCRDLTTFTTEDVWQYVTHPFKPQHILYLLYIETVPKFFRAVTP